MTAAAYRQVIAAPPRDRLDLFLETANRLGAPVGNVEKDFWVCWPLNALYRERPAGGPRLLRWSKHIGPPQGISDEIEIGALAAGIRPGTHGGSLSELGTKHTLVEKGGGPITPCGPTWLRLTGSWFMPL